MDNNRKRTSFGREKQRAFGQPEFVTKRFLQMKVSDVGPTECCQACHWLESMNDNSWGTCRCRPWSNSSLPPKKHDAPPPTLPYITDTGFTKRKRTSQALGIHRHPLRYGLLSTLRRRRVVPSYRSETAQRAVCGPLTLRRTRRYARVSGLRPVERSMYRSYKLCRPRDWADTTTPGLRRDCPRVERRDMRNTTTPSGLQSKARGG